MNLGDWLNALAVELNGFYDEDNNLCVDPGDGLGANTFNYSELVQLYQTKASPRDAADVLRMGGAQ